MCSNTFNSDSGLPFSRMRFLTLCSSVSSLSRSCAIWVGTVASGSDFHLWRHLSDLVAQRFLILSSFFHSSISGWAAANSLLRPSWTASTASKSLILAARLSFRSQILATFSACSRLSETLASNMCSWTSSVALDELNGWLGNGPGPSSMMFICFVPYSAV